MRETCTLKISSLLISSKIQIFTHNAQLFLNRVQRYRKDFKQQNFTTTVLINNRLTNQLIQNKTAFINAIFL